MKKNKSFVIRNIASEIMLVPTDETARDFNGMINLSDTAAFIWNHIEETRSFGELIDLILQEYDIDRETAAQDASAFLMELLERDMVKPSGQSW